VSAARTPDRHGAGVIPVRPDGAILLLLRDNRPDLAAANLWSTLGGRLERGETPEQAAWRELEEESGLRPARLFPAGHVDGPSLREPQIQLRQHIFAASVTWTLDDVILAEGQGVDWFTPEAARCLPIAPPIRPAIVNLLGSALYQSLRDPAWRLPPNISAPLSAESARTLGAGPGRLIAAFGATAGFVRRVWDRLDGARITTSLGPSERPDSILWFPRTEAAAPTLAALSALLAPAGVLWVLLPGSAAPLAPLGAEELRRLARGLGLVEHAAVAVAGGHQGVGFRVAPRHI